VIHPILLLWAYWVYRKGWEYWQWIKFHDATEKKLEVQQRSYIFLR
jgi:hypothetical protein